MKDVTIGGHKFTLRQNTLRTDKVRRVLLRNLLLFLDNFEFESISDEIAFRETHDPAYVEVIGCLYAFDDNPRAPIMRLWSDNIVMWDQWLLDNESVDIQQELWEAVRVARELNPQWYPPTVPTLPEDLSEAVDGKIAAYDPLDETDRPEPDTEEFKATVNAAVEALREKRAEQGFLDQTS